MITLEQTTAAHALHLFNVMQNRKVMCSVELKGGQADPLVGISHQPVSVDCVFDCAPEERTLIIILGEAEFAFDLNSHRFDYDISEHQMDICISSESHSAWFSTTSMKKTVLEEAKAFDPDFNDQVIHMNIDSKNFEDAFQFLTNLIREGRVIKSVKVLGNGNQVLTVGYVSKEQS